jgi:hypothetical protein
MGSTAVHTKVTCQSAGGSGDLPAKLPAKQRSRASNGSRLFAMATADGRSAWARRYRDLLSIHVSDAGGETVISGAELAIIKRATRIEVEMEFSDAVAADKGTASSAEVLLSYCTGSNSMRRLFESVGLKRVARDVTPPTFEDIRAEIDAEKAAAIEANGDDEEANGDDE